MNRIDYCKINDRNWDKSKPVPPRSFTFSQCLSFAALYENLAHQWGSHLHDRNWQRRYPSMSRKDIRREFDNASLTAANWYERAKKAQINGVA